MRQAIAHGSAPNKSRWHSLGDWLASLGMRHRRNGAAGKD